MARFWMVRAGEAGRLFSEFEQAGCVAIGWKELGDISDVQSQSELKEMIGTIYAEYHPSAVANAAAMVWKFKAEMQPGDHVVTYDPSQREYLVGKVTGAYRYAEGVLSDYRQVRSVDWLGKVSRDALSPGAKNTLGSTLTLFEPGSEVLAQLQQALSGDSPTAVSPDADAEAVSVREDQVARAHEFVKDRILKLSVQSKGT